MHVTLRRFRRLYPLLICLACRRGAGAPIEGTGTLEVVEVDVAPMTPARVLRVWRNEGDTVREGDTLVSLTQSTVRADVEARRARLASRWPPHYRPRRTSSSSRR